MDSGYSWIILLACFAIYGVVFGTACSFGVYFVVLIDYFKCDRAEVALVGGVSLSMIALMGPAGAFMFRKYGARITVITGGFIASVGYVTNYFAQSIFHLAVSNGIVGVGMGLGIVSSLAILPQYFHKYNNIAIAFVPIGVPVGLFIFPPLFLYLIEKFTWRGSMLINAGILLQLVVCGSLLKQPKQEVRVKTHKSTVCKSAAKACVVFREAKMILFCLTTIGWAGCSGIFYPMINDLAMRNTGLSGAETMEIVVVSGACDLFGRLSAAAFSHFKHLNNELLYAGGLLILGLSVILSAQSTTLHLFYVSAGCVGFGFGLMISIFGIVALDLFGHKKMSLVLGFGNLFAGIGSLSMPLIAGNLADTFDQRYAFYFGGSVVLILGSFCALLLYFMIHHQPDQVSKSIICDDNEMKE